MKNINEESVKKLDHVVAKNYYFRLDNEGRLTLELTDGKDLEECVALTVHCINQMNSVCPKLPQYTDKASRTYFAPNSDPIKAHRNGFNLAIREVRKLYTQHYKPPVEQEEE
jgi:hypothetical protein